MAEKEKGNSPVKKFRAGAVTATVWKNEAIVDKKTVTFLSTTIERNFKKKDGNWDKTSSFQTRDLPDVELVSKQAYQYIKQESKNEEAE